MTRTHQNSPPHCSSGGEALHFRPSTTPSVRQACVAHRAFILRWVSWFLVQVTPQRTYLWIRWRDWRLSCLWMPGFIHFEDCHEILSGSRILLTPMMCIFNSRFISLIKLGEILQENGHDVFVLMPTFLEPHMTSKTVKKITFPVSFAEFILIKICKNGWERDSRPAYLCGCVIQKIQRTRLALCCEVLYCFLDCLQTCGSAHRPVSPRACCSHHQSVFVLSWGGGLLNFGKSDLAFQAFSIYQAF